MTHSIATAEIEKLAENLRRRANLIKRWDKTSSPERHTVLEGEAVEAVADMVAAAGYLDTLRAAQRRPGKEEIEDKFCEAFANLDEEYRTHNGYVFAATDVALAIFSSVDDAAEVERSTQTWAWSDRRIRNLMAQRDDAEKALAKCQAQLAAKDEALKKLRSEVVAEQLAGTIDVDDWLGQIDGALSAPTSQEKSA